MIRFKWLATVLALTLLALPGAALAQGGGAAGDQYTENAPSASGGGSGGDGNLQSSSSGSSSSGGSDSSTSSSGTGAETYSGGNGGNGGPLNSGTVGKFKHDGKDGSAAKNLAQQTAPDSQALNDAAAAAQQGAGSTSSNVFDSPGDSSSGDGGMGVALPIILGVVLLGGIAYAVSRRRGGPGSSGPKTTSGLRKRLRRPGRPSLPERG